MSKRYEKYKETKNRWFQSIPTHWEVKRLKFMLSRNDGGVWGDDYDGIEENGTKVFRSTEVNADGSWNLNVVPELRVLSESDKEKALLKSGDLIVTKSSGSQLHIGKTALVTKEIETEECCYSNFMQRLRPNKETYSKYLHIFLNCNLARNQYNYLSNSTTGLANLSAGLIGEISIPSQPLSEQTAIADFLEKKTAEMDELIANKQRLIGLLEEEKSALVNNAVTSGVDSENKYQPSPIKFFNIIPANWEIKKLKWVCEIIDCKHTTPEYIVEGIPVVSTGNVKPGKISLDSARKVTVADFEVLSEGDRRPKQGDIIYSRNASVGAAALVRSNEQFCLGQDICIIRSSENQEYLEMLLNCDFIISQLESVLVGSTFRRINIQQIKEFILVIPSREEQLRIVDFVTKNLEKLNYTIGKVFSELELLKEYRSSLINEAVTGKIKLN